MQLEIRAGLLAGIATLMTQFAWAQTPIGNAQQATSPALSPAYCKQSTLTGLEFIKVIQSIITHGDLTDIKFIKRTLGVKFVSRNGWMGDGSPDPQTLLMESTDTLQVPIDTHLIINYDKHKQLRSNLIAGLSFRGRSNYIVDCLQINKTYFVSSFGVNFVGLPTGAGSPTASETSAIGITGKNGSKIHITFYYEFNQDLVTDVSLYQQPSMLSHRIGDPE